jgi:hypothetical protein
VLWFDPAVLSGEPTRPAAKRSRGSWPKRPFGTKLQLMVHYYLPGLHRPGYFGGGPAGGRLNAQGQGLSSGLARRLR